MDGNSEDEMVVRVNDFILILNAEDNKVYGYGDVIRGMLYLKEDGTYLASGGADVSGIFHDSYNKNKRETTTLAENDNGKVIIEGIAGSKSDYDNYREAFMTKKDAEFTLFNEAYEVMPKEKQAFIEGPYYYTYSGGTEKDGQKDILTLIEGKATFEDQYFGDIYTGTYQVFDDNIIINFTYHKGFDQSIDAEYEENVTKSLILNIQNNKLIDAQSTHIYTYAHMYTSDK